MIDTITPYTNYQLSAIGVGVIATGLEDIRQCIDFILRTIPGSDPLRPLFGSNIYKYIDAPVNTMIPNAKKEIFEAISLWEPRITVISITHEIISSQVKFYITYGIDDTEIVDMLSWLLTGVSQDVTAPSGIIISAVIPQKISNGQYNIIFIINGTNVYPLTPSSGFSSADDLYSWVSANWFNYGRWYLTENKLVLYMNSGIAKTASLVVTQTATLTISTYIPILSSDDYYQLAFTLDGVVALPVFPANTLSTVEQLLFWITSNWNNYGTWSLQNNGDTISEGDFSTDFSTDFDIGGIQPERYLIFQTQVHTTATLSFI